jgi:hypothetical protein
MNPRVTIPIAMYLIVVLDTSGVLVGRVFRGIWSSRFEIEVFGAPVRMMYATQRAVKLLLENRITNMLHNIRVGRADAGVDSSFEYRRKSWQWKIDIGKKVPRWLTDCVILRVRLVIIRPGGKYKNGP